jgi:hypothetical protein
MDKKELIKFLYTEIGDLQAQLADYGDLDELVQNVASNGNHDDTYEMGVDIGWITGSRKAFETILSILVETPDVEHTTN